MNRYRSPRPGWQPGAPVESIRHWYGEHVEDRRPEVDGLAPWDLAAGSLLIRESGGIVSGLDGSEDYLDSGHVLTGTPKIYAMLAQLCSKEIKALLA